MESEDFIPQTKPAAQRQEKKTALCGAGAWIVGIILLYAGFGRTDAVLFACGAFLTTIGALWNGKGV